MKKRGAVCFLLLFLLIALPAVSQDTASSKDAASKDAASSGDDGSKTGPDFFLLPILETVFSGELRWRPDWPDDIPPDAFSLSRESPSLEEKPQVIEISNDDFKFAVRRNSDGRLVEFPLFLENGYAKVEAAYAETGALVNMQVSFFAAQNPSEDGASPKDGADSSAVKDPSAIDDPSAAEGKIWNIEFPAGFLPYSELSPGGSFPPIKITSEESDFYLFIFESASFLTETWYDSESEMLVFCKANVSRGNHSWRVRSLQIHDESGVRFIDYNFDSYGNTTGVRFQDKNFSALYREDRPVYWQTPGLRYELQWDTRGGLTVVKAAGESEDLNAEYRYEYEMDNGNWVKRLETALKDKFGLLTPQPSFSRGVWNRRIDF